MASGRPDWFGTIVAAGKYDDTYLPIALDVDGFITATMKGAYDAVLKTIAVDSSGVMKANISVQDLNFLTVRPAYGQTQLTEGDSVIANTTETEIFSISGQGILIGGIIRWDYASEGSDLTIRIFSDTVRTHNNRLSDLMNRFILNPLSNPVYIIRYDDTLFKYVAGIQPGQTFESNFTIKIYHTLGAAATVYWEVVYALTP